MLCVAATTTVRLRRRSASTGRSASEAAREASATDRTRARLAPRSGPMHIAETREEARAERALRPPRLGSATSARSRLPLGRRRSPTSDPVEAMISAERPRRDRHARRRRSSSSSGLEQQSGERCEAASCQLAHNWANFESTKKSPELWARRVVAGVPERQRAPPPSRSAGRTTMRASSSAPPSPPHSRCSSSTPRSRRRRRRRARRRPRRSAPRAEARVDVGRWRARGSRQLDKCAFSLAGATLALATARSRGVQAADRDAGSGRRARWAVRRSAIAQGRRTRSREVRSAG